MPDSAHQLDAATRQILLQHVRTFEDLEMLLLLARDARRFWSAAAAASELGLAEAAAQTALDSLASHNFLEVRFGEDVLYRLDPNSPRTAAAVQRILDAARRHRTAVLSAIAGAGRAVGDFADAFRIKKRTR